MKVGEAFVEIRPDTRGFQSEAEGQIGGTFRKVAGIAASAFAAAGVGKAIASVIGGASDLNETISKSNTIFGSSGKAIEAWAGTAAKSMGQSKQQALEAAATFGNMFSQLGIGGEQTAAMSQQMVQLATDFASFHNADITEVLRAQQAAFRGEYDAVQRFVPTITAAAVEQRALADTHKKTTKELTAQDKALATQKLLMEGAGAAVGDFSRTSGGLANQQRILSAQFQNVKDKIGQALLPVITQVVTFINTRLIPGLGLIGEKLRPFIEQVKLIASAFAAAFSGEGVTSDGIVGTFERIGVAMRQVVDFVQANLQPILIGLGIAFLALTSPITLIIGALVLLYTRFEGVRTVVGAVVAFVVQQFTQFAGFVQSVLPAVQEAIGHFVAAAQAAWRLFGDDIIQVVTTAFNLVRATVQNVMAVIENVIRVVLAVINGDWGAAWNALKAIAGAVLNEILAVLRAGLGLLRGIFGAAFDAAKAAVVASAGNIVSFVAGIPGKIKGALGNLAGTLISAGHALMDGLLKGIVEGFKKVAGYVGGLAGKIASLKGPLDYDRVLLIPNAHAIMDGLLQGLRDKFPALAATLGNVSNMIGSSVTAALPTVPTSENRGGGFGADDWSPNPGEQWAWNGKKWVLVSSGGTGAATAVGPDGRTQYWTGDKTNGPWSYTPPAGAAATSGNQQIVVELVVDGQRFTAAIVDPMAEALRRRDAAYT